MNQMEGKEGAGEPLTFTWCWRRWVTLSKTLEVLALSGVMILMYMLGYVYMDTRGQPWVYSSGTVYLFLR